MTMKKITTILIALTLLAVSAYALDVLVDVGGTGTGFPGATTAAHTALVEAWHREDRALLTALHDASAKLHHLAKTYAGTDDDNADHITTSAHPTPDTNGTVPTPLNL